MDERTLQSLRLMVLRVEDDSRFVAHALKRYRHREGLSEEDLKHRLSASPEAFVRLALCKQPDPDSPILKRHLQEISTYTGVEEARLADVFAREHPQNQRLAADQKSTHGSQHWLRRTLTAILIARPVIASTAALVLLAACLAVVYFALRHDRGATQQVANDSDAPASSFDQQVRTPSGHIGEQSKPSSSEHANRNALGKAGLGLLVATVYINLDEQQMLRGADEAATKSIKLPLSEVRLVLDLPEGSASGNYEVRIEGPFGERLVSRRAFTTDGRHLTFTLDLGGLQAGNYHLCVVQTGNSRQQLEVPDCFAISVDAAVPSTRR